MQTAMTPSEPTSRPWILAETTYDQVRQLDYQVAILPLGATEPHNLHLPYGTDTIEATGLVERICSEAWRQGARVVMLPEIPYGTETNMREFPLAMNLSPTTLFAVLQDLIQSVGKSGIRKMVLFNSHGGNDFKPFLRQIYGQTQVQLFLCDWFKMVADRQSEIFEHKEDHAGEMETSLVMHLTPHLVQYQADGKLHADSGAVNPMRFEALRRGWVGITRPWHLLTTNSGSGNPHAATPEKGKAVAELVSERLVPFLVELAASPLDPSFPF
jgi:creatinine amidohydrolase